MFPAASKMLPKSSSDFFGIVWREFLLSKSMKQLQLLRWQDKKKCSDSVASLCVANILALFQNQHQVGPRHLRRQLAQHPERQLDRRHLVFASSRRPPGHREVQTRRNRRRHSLRRQRNSPKNRTLNFSDSNIWTRSSSAALFLAP